MKNPYAPPASVVTAAPTLSHTIQGELVEGGWLRRRIRITGQVRALIEFNGRWPTEVVMVNGLPAVRQRNWSFARIVCPSFEFVLPGDIHARLELDSSWFPAPGLRGVRLYVNDDLVYSEP